MTHTAHVSNCIHHACQTCPRSVYSEWLRSSTLMVIASDAASEFEVLDPARHEAMRMYLVNSR